MTAIRSTPFAPSALADDQRRAETLLFELASALRFVPVEETTRDLHIRALELKRTVRDWMREPPAASAREATCDEILELQARTKMALAFGSARAARQA